MNRDIINTIVALLALCVAGLHAGEPNGYLMLLPEDRKGETEFQSLDAWAKSKIDEIRKKAEPSVGR